MQQINTEILSGLSLSGTSADKVLDRFDAASALCRGNYTAQPVIQPVPLCNNHLRPDTVCPAYESPGVMPPLPRKKSSAGVFRSGMSIVESSALIRTEAASWQDILRIWGENAEKSGFFSLRFEENILRRVNTENISSMCFGVPFGVTESIYVRSCQIPWGPLPPRDADAVSSLLCEGAIPIGYIKSSPFNMGPDMAAQAVAGGTVPFSLGVDMGGSGLVNAARTGVTAMRTTYGLCSRFGVLCRAPSLELICVNAGSVRDLAMVSRILFQGCRNDCTSYSQMMPGWYETLSHIEIKNYTVGFAENMLDQRKNPYATAAVLKAAEAFELLGGTVRSVRLPLNGTENELMRIIAAGECRIEDMTGCRRGNPDLSALPEAAREEILFKRLLLKEGTVLNGARIRRGQLIQGFERALSDVNAVICPAVWDDGSASDMPAALSLIGMCGLTLPCGKTPEGQNLGLLIAARQFSEDTLLILGKIYEQANHMSREVVRRGRHCRIPH